VPQGQKVAVVHEADGLPDALERMIESGFSYLPVTRQGCVVGVVSVHGALRSLLEDPRVRQILQERAIGAIMKTPNFVGPSEWVDDQFDWCNDEAALVGSPEQVHGIITAADLLQRLHDFSAAFLQLSEIEANYRAIYSHVFPWKEWQARIHRCIRNRSTQGESQYMPTSVSDMTYWHYEALLLDKETGAQLERYCMKSLDWMARKTAEARYIRNDTMHFRRKIDPGALEKLQQLNRELVAIVASIREH
jgi:CBS domain-containing protein